MARISLLAAAALAPLAAAASGRFRASSGVTENINAGWPTAHHDIRNSGVNDLHVGPAEAKGICRYSFFKDSPTDISAARYYATGVTSTANENVQMFAGTDAIFRIVQLIEETSIIREHACDITQWRPQGNPAAAPYGIVADATVFPFVDSSSGKEYDRVVIPSSDGHIYAINYEMCIAIGGGVCNYTQRYAPPQGASRRTGSSGSSNKARRAAAFTSNLGAPDCLQWAVKLSTGNPSFGPTRYVEGPLPGAPRGIVLATSTDAALDTNGVLHAFDPDTGAQLWTHAAVANAVPVGLRGIVPAVDQSRGSLLYLAYGSVIVALNASSGAVLASLDTASEPLVSSVTLTSDSSTLFVHSTLGSILKVSLSGPATALTMTLLWTCDYNLESWGAKTNPCTTGDALAHAGSRHAPWPVMVPDATRRNGRRATGELLSVRRDDFVSGGFPQVTTRAEKEELYAALETAATRWAAEEATAGRLISMPAVNAFATPEQRAAALAALLPRSRLDALVLSTGYTRLDGRGVPHSVAAPRRPAKIGVGAAWESEYPYATVTTLSADTYIAISQYIAFGLGDNGFFVANAVTGQPVWAFENFTVGLPVPAPFGRSRSSPAVDAAEAIYVGADIDWPFTGDTLPCLFAFTPVMGGGANGYEFQWGTSMGLEDNVTVAAASPVVKLGFGVSNEVYMVAEDGVVGVTEGLECASSSPLLECSGKGTCDCFSGLCLCKDPCNAGLGCTPTCAHGTCSVSKKDNKTALCQCPRGWRGSTCSESESDNEVSSLVITMVAVPVAFTAVAALGVGLWKRRNPTSPLHSLLPETLQRYLGYRKYQPVKTSSTGGSSYGGVSSTSFLSSDTHYGSTH